MPMRATMLRIREFKEADAPAVLRLARALQAYEARLFERMKPPEEIGLWYLDALLRGCREKHGALVVAEDEAGQVVGYATVLFAGPDSMAETEHRHGRVGDLIVSEEARRRGVGGALLAECERRARAAGVDELRLDVLAANRQARGAYASLGFEDLHVTMRKKLRP
jgi:ribosomal protein S18 acetylase RimI-like enzyme